MSDKELFSDLLQAFHEYEDAVTLDDDEEEPEDMVAAEAAADQAEAELKRVFDAYILDLLKRKGKGVKPSRRRPSRLPLLKGHAPRRASP